MALRFLFLTWELFSSDMTEEKWPKGLFPVLSAAVVRVGTRALGSWLPALGPGWG